MVVVMRSFLLVMVESARAVVWWGLRKCLIWILVFFFQAEDGIRDLTVTGVQTCALPILMAAAAGHPATRWCVTVLNPDGTAAAHGCAAGTRPWVPGPPGPMPLRGLLDFLKIGRASCRERV